MRALTTVLTGLPEAQGAMQRKKLFCDGHHTEM
jgi:hypothetical protein